MRSKLTRWAIFAAMCASPLIVGQNAVFADTPPPAATPAQGKILARVNGKDITAKKLAAILEARQPLNEMRVKPGQIKTLDEDSMKSLLTQLGAEEIIAERAKKEGVELLGADRDRAAGMLERYVGLQLYREDILGHVRPANEEDMIAEYALRKETYKEEKTFTFRILYLGTYIPYVVKEGDTLRSIAQEISGDEASFEKILSDDTKQPRFQSLELPAEEKKADPAAAAADSGETTPLASKATPTPAADANDKSAGVPDPVPTPAPLAPKALTKGELLLVPMNDADVEKVHQKMTELAAQARGGTLFETLAQEHSENEAPGQLLTYRPAKDKPYHPEILKALETLEVGGISEPLRTRHGFHIVEKESYTAEGYKPMDQVTESVKQFFSERQADEITKQWFASYAQRHKDTFKVNRELLAKSGADAERLKKDQAEGVPPEDPNSEVAKARIEEEMADIVVEVGAVKINRRDFVNGFRRLRMPPEQTPWGMTDEGIFEILPSHPMYRNQTYKATIEELGLKERPESKDFQKEVELGMLATQYINTQGDKDATKEPTEEELKKFYADNSQRFLMRGTASIARIVLPLKALGPDAAKREQEFRDQVKASLEGVQSRQQFDAVAKRFARLFRGVQPPSPMDAGTNLTADFGADVAKVIEVTPEKSLTDVIKTDESLQIIWVDTVTKERQPEFSEITPSIREAYIELKRTTAREAILAAAVAETKVEIVDIAAAADAVTIPGVD